VPRMAKQRFTAEVVDGAVDIPDAVIEAPPELAAAFEVDATAKATWAALSYTHQREYAQWITEAKKPETRERRAAQAVERLAAGQKTFR
jgi:uncharacterized protein YdeI (YjbR/CyaY-like superfamily)